jgi:acetyl-CoA synthetase
MLKVVLCLALQGAAGFAPAPRHLAGRGAALRSSIDTAITRTEVEPVPVPSEYEPINLPDFATYEAMYKRSIEDPDGFWGDIAREFHWEKEWTGPVVRSNFKRSEGKIETAWFEGGITNLCYNALDRHVEAGHGDQVCFIAERNDYADDAPQPAKCVLGRAASAAAPSAARAPSLSRSSLSRPLSSRRREAQTRARALSRYTYAETLAEVKKMAAALRAQGVKKGDRVALFMPMVPELPIAMLACARIGAVHSVVFGGFSPEALAVRMQESGSSALITCDGVMRGKKRIALWGIAAKALALAADAGTQVDTTIMLQRTGLVDGDPALDSTPCASVQWWQDATAAAAADADGEGGAVEWVDAEHPLFILYTSGSTGKPKGVLHTTGGYMISAATTFKYVFDVHSRERGDVFFCTADCGWITGHSCVSRGPAARAPRAAALLFLARILRV